ncbi:hypothetical protein SRHO_G00061560 [Serrasalmus rhombeus]
MTSPLCSLIGWRPRPASPIAGRRGDVNGELPAKTVRRGAGRRGAYVGGRVNRLAVIGCDRIRGEGLLLREKRARVERRKQRRRGTSALILRGCAAVLPKAVRSSFRPHVSHAYFDNRARPLARPPAPIGYCILRRALIGQAAPAVSGSFTIL